MNNDLKTEEKLDRKLVGKESLKRREKMIWNLEAQRAGRVLESFSSGDMD